MKLLVPILFGLMGMTACVLLTDESRADVRDRFESHVYQAGERKLPYRLLRPKNYDPAQRYPLVLFLHGAGERGDDNQVQLIHGMADFASDDVMERFPAFVIAPQCPKGEKWADVDWSLPKHSLPDKPASAMAMTFAVLEQLERENSIDPRRRYITGLSMGGYGTWDALARQPEYFAAAMPICGGADEATAAKIAKIPVWVFHGDQDQAVPVARSRNMVAALKAAGGSPQYTEYPNVGHNAWSATYSNRDVLKWLFDQRRPE